MPDAASTPPAQNIGRAPRPEPAPPRDRLARLVVVGSFLTIFLLVAALLGISQIGRPDAAQMAERTFTTILPVLAGWVGSVLAFYFSAANFERTSNTLDQAIRQAAQGPGTGVTVSEKMIPASSIRKLFDFGKELPPEKISLDVLRKRFDGTDGGAPITRMVFVERGVFR